VTVPAIGAIAPITPIVTSTAPASAAGGANFANVLANGLDQLQSMQANADNLAVQAAAGTLSDPAQYMVASTQANLATELTVAVRNKAVDAFNEIMRMQA
jgi:flagellar hook-basal body complex protein FliE